MCVSTSGRSCRGSATEHPPPDGLSRVYSLPVLLPASEAGARVALHRDRAPSTCMLTPTGVTPPKNCDARCPAGRVVNSTSEMGMSCSPQLPASLDIAKALGKHRRGCSDQMRFCVDSAAAAPFGCSQRRRQLSRPPLNFRGGVEAAIIRFTPSRFKGNFAKSTTRQRPISKKCRQKSIIT